MQPFSSLDDSAYDLPSSLTERVLTPALVVHLDRVRSNIARVIELAGGEPDRWRPHLKTTKMPEVWRELLAAGVRQFKCATTREAAVLLTLLEQEGVAADLLVAYPLLGPALSRLGTLAQSHPSQRVSVLCEDLSVLESVPPSLGIFIDVNTGMNRTGVPLAEGARIQALARASGARFRGLHAYEGHLHELDFERRRTAAFEEYERIVALVRELAGAGCAVPELVTSGTPGLLCALSWPEFGELEDCLHRVSPGTVVFHDLRSEQETPELRLAPAATVLTRVVSHPRQGIATCDAGSKALAAEAGDPVAYVLGHPELVATTPNEEHLPLRSTAGELPALGSLLHLVPMHVCPTVNLAETAILIEGRREARFISVQARAHEVKFPPAPGRAEC